MYMCHQKDYSHARHVSLSLSTAAMCQAMLYHVPLYFGFLGEARRGPPLWIGIRSPGKAALPLVEASTNCVAAVGWGGGRSGAGGFGLPVLLLRTKGTLGGLDSEG